MTNFLVVIALNLAFNKGFFYFSDVNVKSKTSKL